MTKHTPTQEKLRYTIGGLIFRGNEEIAITLPGGIGKEKKAQFIVTACNSHEELIKLLIRTVACCGDELPSKLTNEIMQALAKAGAHGKN